MQLVKEKTSIVLSGIWNPAILSPKWVAENVLNKKGEDVPVEIDMPVPLSSGGPWRFHLNGIMYVPHRNRLEVAPDGSATEESFRNTASFVKSVLALLPHTPISAMGQNFAYEEPTPTPEQIALVIGAKSIILSRATSEQFDIGRQETLVQFNLDNRLLNLKLILDSGTFSAEFNFHYPERPDANLCETLPQTFVNNFEYSKKLATEIFEAEVTV